PPTAPAAPEVVDDNHRCKDANGGDHYHHDDSAEMPNAAPATSNAGADGSEATAGAHRAREECEEPKPATSAPGNGVSATATPGSDDGAPKAAPGFSSFEASLLLCPQCRKAMP